MYQLAKDKYRMHIFQFVICFFLANIFLSLLISVNYFYLLPNFDALAQDPLLAILIWMFLLISWIAQIALVFLFCFLIIVAINIFLPRIVLISILSILVGASLSFAQIGDSIAFRIYHMHYAILGWEVFKAKAFSQVISFSYIEILLFSGITVLLIVLECFIAWLVWQYVRSKPVGKWRYHFIVISIFCLITSYTFTFIAKNDSENRIIKQSHSYLLIKATRFIPYYDEIYRMIMPTFTTSHHILMSGNKIFTFKPPKNDQILFYPKHGLQCEESNKPINILVIVVDTWRYDAMNVLNTPNIYKFAKQSLQFQNHWSGGNCTKAGIFSLFYGLPANYWDAFYQEQRGPELINQLIKEKYQIGIFASAHLDFPAFDKTIFSAIKSSIIDTKGDNTVARDKQITENFKNFLITKQSQQPFFGFLFYDSVHNYCESVIPSKPYQPAVKVCNRFGLTKDSDPTEYLNRYRNAVHFVDNEIGKVLDALKQQNLLQNTMVIITADHGEEINDNHSGYWQHASAYTSYQLHVPLIVYWPHHKPKVYKHFTDHYDIVPTLMTSVINCKNPIQDYAIGSSLFTQKRHSHVLISNGYADYAIISENQIVRLYDSGDYMLEDRHGQPIEGKGIKIDAFLQASKYLNAYFIHK